MRPCYGVQAQSKDDVLLLELSGEFGSEAAWDLFNLLALRDTGRGEIVIDTDAIDSVAPIGRAVFRNLLKLSMMPVDRMRFKGSQARFMV
ncbi:MAG: hypothetical protein CSA22_03395 [Deltaproteobacteria bacterium]|nr:MAG: hypothetical protein CSA22_03395 [Deltaproteobacteria bacterium]